ncbi:GntR family transcriptional regulator [Sphingopyxis fribergensis]|uniref:GntR family transcriptional regulator n=1 Tax=Sphingopyxis fribergensis TaxID=1515612 RepID=A0A0A7PJB6_9SPHN|nr:UTRA domain-containing protein [Sphingopyxis fribergensis]AJA10090.1 GntR family transcriptional regulator [Sphingopyxis fribergensis]
MNPARRIRDEIAAAIQSGEWRPGDRVPTEQELAARYRCARATVSKALGELAAMGLVERRRKAGTFVAHPPVHSAVMTVPDLAELIAARGEVYRWDLASVETVKTDDDLLAGTALRIEGVHMAAGEAFALERRFIALGEVPEAADADFAKEAPGTWLLGHIPWTQARHVIRAVTPTHKEAALLAIGASAACLELDRMTWRAGRVVTHVRQLFRGDRFDLIADFNAGP